MHARRAYGIRWVCDGCDGARHTELWSLNSELLAHGHGFFFSFGTWLRLFGTVIDSGSLMLSTNKYSIQRHAEAEISYGRRCVNRVHTKEG